MSIYNIDFTSYEQTFKVKEEDKKQYGEIYTPFSLIDQMLDTFDPRVFTDPTKRWLDVGAGRGYITMKVFERLNKGLASSFADELLRKKHILTRMLFLVEIKADNVIALKEMFGAEANIFHADFCGSAPALGAAAAVAPALGAAVAAPALDVLQNMDFIIGNPPYNVNGLKKVPTEKTRSKKEDGTTLWRDFIHKSLALLKPMTGQLCLIVPSIWLKPDQYGIHQKLTQYKIEKIHCFSGNETNTFFKGAAQTPTCFFLLTNCAKPARHMLSVYDKDRASYVFFAHQPGTPIPLFGQHIIKKLQPWIEAATVGPLTVLKSNMPSKKTTFSTDLNESTASTSMTHPYPNIKTCLLEGTAPTLLVNYSDIPQAFHGVKKIVMAHKMYGFPYFDKCGHYGISNRDNYVICGKTDAEFEQLQRFLASKLVLYIFEAARYRMKCLEKYAFQFIPDITRISGFPRLEPTATMSEIDSLLANYFGLDEIDMRHINRLHKKSYKSFLH